MCSAAGPWRSSTRRKSSRNSSSGDGVPEFRRAPGAHRQVPGRRHRGGTWTPSPTASGWSSAGIMEHIERAGVHSGDSACSIPPRTLSPEVQSEIRRQAVALATALKVRGLMNVQFAVKGSDVYILEVNPRASRTVPSSARPSACPLAKLASRVMVGRRLDDLGLTREIVPRHVSVKESVLPFNKFAGVDTLLGPEMKSTGEVMGIDHSFGKAYAKAQMAGGMTLPDSGTAFFSLPDEHREGAAGIARSLAALGFRIAASGGTAGLLPGSGHPVEIVDDAEEMLRRESRRHGRQHPCQRELPQRRLPGAPQRPGPADPVLHHPGRSRGRAGGHRVPEGGRADRGAASGVPAPHRPAPECRVRRAETGPVLRRAALPVLPGVRPRPLGEGPG